MQSAAPSAIPDFQNTAKRDEIQTAWSPPLLFAPGN
jgi:hypothetical protein